MTLGPDSPVTMSVSRFATIIAAVAVITAGAAASSAVLFFRLDAHERSPGHPVLETRVDKMETAIAVLARIVDRHDREIERKL